jgi:hypothetical protein
LKLRPLRLSPECHRRAFAAATALLLLFGGYSVSFAQQTAVAGNDEEGLAEKEYDPTASLTQFKIQDIYTPAEYGTNAQLNTLQIRPLLAVRPQLFTPLEQLIRPSIQIVTVPRSKDASTTTALDDFQLLDLFVMPWPNEKETRFRWGIGPYFVFRRQRVSSQGKVRGRWVRPGPSATEEFHVSRLPVFFSRRRRLRTHPRILFRRVRSRSNRCSPIS